MKDTPLKAGIYLGKAGLRQYLGAYDQEVRLPLAEGEYSLGFAEVPGYKLLQVEDGDTGQVLQIADPAAIPIFLSGSRSLVAVYQKVAGPVVVPPTPTGTFIDIQVVYTPPIPTGGAPLFIGYDSQSLFDPGEVSGPWPSRLGGNFTSRIEGGSQYIEGRIPATPTTPLHEHQVYFQQPTGGGMTYWRWSSNRIVAADPEWTAKYPASRYGGDLTYRQFPISEGETVKIVHRYIQVPTFHIVVNMIPMPTTGYLPFNKIRVGGTEDVPVVFTRNIGPPPGYTEKEWFRVEGYLTRWEGSYALWPPQPDPATNMMTQWSSLFPSWKYVPAWAMRTWGAPRPGSAAGTWVNGHETYELSFTYSAPV